MKRSIYVIAAAVILAVLSLPEAARGGSIVSWGYDNCGQVSNTPTESGFTAIAGGGNHSLALTADGFIVSWGYGGDGQVSNTPAGNGFTVIAAGHWHSLALKSDGSIVSWGSDGERQVSNTPVESGFIAIVAGGWHSLALKSNGSIVSWGYDPYGQVSNTPTESGFTAIAGGCIHSLALRADGSIVSWGYDEYGQVSTTPTESGFVDIAAGYYHSLALRADGSIVSWGSNSYGQVSGTPTESGFTAIAAGYGYSLALRADGSIVSWGYDPYGQVSGTPTESGFTAIAAGNYHNLALTSELTAPPVADAGGPYSVYVGDSLVLDGSGSTDADNDIVSYMWDLDDVDGFETEAGGQAIFEVSYAYLQSLGLIVNHVYNIHVQVNDSEGQSDVADSTLVIVPKPAVQVAVDIKPGSCPNPVNVKSSGVLPIAILGTADCDVTTIDATSVRLAGVEPLRSSLEDVAGLVSDANGCNCTTDGADGLLDLTLKFETQKIVGVLGEVNDGDVLELRLTGVLFDPVPFETPIEGADCIVIRGRHKPFNKGDINKDGVVNVGDLNLLIENWLKSSVAE